ncbi:MAG: hypothetical protein FJ090_17760 [Deltaproteobacteria bacterium]|nr:hypothetical protein [Deltaproteobacteria bacterium]
MRLAALATLVALALAGVVTPGALVVDAARADALPSAQLWLGADHLGRPVLARLAVASTTLFPAALGAALICALGGVSLGVLDAWFGGAPGALARIARGSLAALPRLVLALLLVMGLGGSPLAMALASGLAFAPALADAVADRIGELNRAEFVVAARGQGIPDARILAYHLVYVACGPAIVRGAGAAAGGVVVLDATLAYLGGLGVAEPTPTFGNMLALAITWGGDNVAAWAAPGLCVVLASLASAWTPGRR